MKVTSNSPYYNLPQTYQIMDRKYLSSYCSVEEYLVNKAYCTMLHCKVWGYEDNRFIY